MKTRMIILIGEGAIVRPLNIEGKRQNRVGGFNNGSSRHKGSIGPGISKTFWSNMTNDHKYRASVSPGQTYLRVGRQTKTRSSSVNARQERSKFQKRISTVQTRLCVDALSYSNNQVAINNCNGSCPNKRGLSFILNVIILSC